MSKYLLVFAFGCVVGLTGMYYHHDKVYYALGEESKACDEKVKRFDRYIENVLKNKIYTEDMLTSCRKDCMRLNNDD